MNDEYTQKKAKQVNRVDVDKSRYRERVLSEKRHLKKRKRIAFNWRSNRLQKKI
ncbi:hypothetical protein Q0F98_22030 [Paenibacillus amylolyticus]|nr:hypothetical protein Q0F98_22030 [Paenibacillus amylolyticus]